MTRDTAVTDGQWKTGVVLVILLLTGLATWRSFVLDDAFISFRYAEHLAVGHGLVFNPNEWVEVYWDTSSALLVRNIPANSEYLKNLGLSHYTSRTTGQALSLYEASTGDRLKLARDVSQIVSFKHHWVLSDYLSTLIEGYPGTLTLEQGKALLLPPLKYNDDNPDLWLALGRHYQAYGKSNEAAEALIRARNLGVDNI